jgi:hypothetical protein
MSATACRYDSCRSKLRPPSPPLSQPLVRILPEFRILELADALRSLVDLDESADAQKKTWPSTYRIEHLKCCFEIAGKALAVLKPFLAL